MTDHDFHETCRACGHGLRSHLLSTGCITCGCPQFRETIEEKVVPPRLSPVVVNNSAFPSSDALVRIEALLNDAIVRLSELETILGKVKP